MDVGDVIAVCPTTLFHVLVTRKGAVRARKGDLGVATRFVFCEWASGCAIPRAT
jgi:hypothetical protein